MQIAIPGLQVSIHQDAIEVTTKEGDPDPAWTATDSSGFVHCWDMDPDHPEVPTYIWVTDIEADEEYPESGHWESCFTGEKMLWPGRVVTPHREFIGGLRHLTFVATPEYEQWGKLTAHYVSETHEEPVEVEFGYQTIHAIITAVEFESGASTVIRSISLTSTGSPSPGD